MPHASTSRRRAKPAAVPDRHPPTYRSNAGVPICAARMTQIRSFAHPCAGAAGRPLAIQGVVDVRPELASIWRHRAWCCGGLFAVAISACLNPWPDDYPSGGDDRGFVRDSDMGSGGSGNGQVGGGEGNQSGFGSGTGGGGPSASGGTGSGAAGTAGAPPNGADAGALDGGAPDAAPALGVDAGAGGVQ